MTIGSVVRLFKGGAFEKISHAVSAHRDTCAPDRCCDSIATMTVERLPWAASMRVRDARDAYLRENGFTVQAYDEPWTQVAYTKRIRFAIPNTAAHRRGIMLHDLHHVATGYGTDLTGEGEISAWELRLGLRGLDLYVGSIVTGGFLMGLAVAPLRTRRAWSAADTCKSNLFADELSYEALLAMTVGDLRTHLGIDVNGIAAEPRGLHAGAPSAA